MAIFAGTCILKVFPNRIENKLYSVAVDIFFKIVHLLVYILDEWILFTVFCKNVPWAVYLIFDAKDIWPHHLATSVLMWPILSGNRGPIHEPLCILISTTQVSFTVHKIVTTRIYLKTKFHTHIFLKSLVNWLKRTYSVMPIPPKLCEFSATKWVHVVVKINFTGS